MEVLEDFQEEVTGTLRNKGKVLWVSGVMEAREKSFCSWCGNGALLGR